MATPPFDVEHAHRWFAVELNNLAWDLVEAEERSPADVERMIDAAHAACFHWKHSGSVLNHLRAQCLLATAYAKAGLGEAAVRHAERCLLLSAEVGEQQTEFDRATAHGCASVAHRMVGRINDARAEYERAQAAVSGFCDPADATLFAKLYPVP